MERAHTDEARLPCADKHLQSRTHLVGSLVGESHRAYSLWLDAVTEDEMCDPGSKNFGLSTAGSRQNLQRNIGGVLDGFKSLFR